MSQPLAATLLQLIDAVRAPDIEGLRVTEAEIELPLEVSLHATSGVLEFRARAPHTRWKAGVLPPVSRTRICIAWEEA